MSGEVWVILSFLLFMFFFAGVGMASIRVKKDTTDDYLVAGRGMHPALAALSAVSTWNSGYMFIGFIGFMWLMGYSAIWISVISTIGQLVAWIWLYKYIQNEGNERNIRSLSSLVANVKGAPEAKMAAICSVAFLLIYAGAQLSSGGKALFAMLGWAEYIGIIIGFVLVVAYCYAGGIRASIWTDAAQSCVMIVGSTLLCYVALTEVGWFSGLHNSLNNIDPALTSITPPDLKFGFSMWVFAFFLGGLGVAGQPQVVSRIMTLESEEDRKQACLWFFIWQTPFLALMIIIGLASRVIFPESGTFDPELALPMLAMDVLGPFWVGLILASIFAATMSTADSQVLACTAAITDDVIPEWSTNHKKTKITTMVMAFVATCLSLGAYFTENNSVFSLVVLAVYGLGGMFIPLILIRMSGFKPSSKHSIIMMSSALIAVITWRILGFNVYIFESVPGMGAAFIAHLIMVVKEKHAWLDLPQQTGKKIVTFGVGILLLIIPIEYYYATNAPTSMSSSSPDPDSMWNLTVDFEYSYAEETIIINDGETNSFYFDIPADAVSVSFMLNYSESNEFGLSSQCDEISVPAEFIIWNLENISGQNCGENSIGGFSTWSAFSQIDTYENQRAAIDALTNEKDSGEIVFNVRVDVNQGLSTGDNGEEITMSVSYL
ncbi:MAG: sodium/proline symporter, partial [Candidatus Poseidoniaceae archaeon]